MNFLKNRYIRIIGALIILYFGLFLNTSNKDSLGNRFSKTQIKKDLSDARTNSIHIISNVRKAQEYKQNHQNTISKKQQHNLKDFIIKDIIAGKASNAIKCGDLVTIDYKSFNNSKEIESVRNYQFTIGKDQLDPVIQNYIIGMKEGGTRLIILTSATESLNYEVTLNKVKESVLSEKEKCNFNQNP